MNDVHSGVASQEKCLSRAFRNYSLVYMYWLKNKWDRNIPSIGYGLHCFFCPQNVERCTIYYLVQLGLLGSCFWITGIIPALLIY